MHRNLTYIGVLALTLAIVGGVAQLALRTPQPDAVVRMTSRGFEPARLSVTVGSRIRFTNDDTRWRWPASNSHPTHELYPEFDPLEPVAEGEYWDFVARESGTWGFHDHMVPNLRGILTVE